MEKRHLEQFLNKRVIVRLINQWVYRGLLLKLDNDTAFIDDIKGKVVVELAEYRGSRYYNGGK